MVYQRVLIRVKRFSWGFLKAEHFMDSPVEDKGLCSRILLAPERMRTHREALLPNCQTSIGSRSRPAFAFS